MTMDQSYPQRPDGDTEPARAADLAKVVRAARLVQDGKSQKDIAKIMNISTSSVSRLLTKAEAENILRVMVVPPRLVVYEESLHAQLIPFGVKRTIVVPDGPGRNVENLGSEGATVLMDAILQLAQIKPRTEPIRIVLSCGTTVLNVLKQTSRQLRRYCIRENNSIRNALRIFPSTLVSDFEFNAVYPHTAVTIFANDLRSIPEEQLKVSAFAPQLPKNFYQTYEKDDRARRNVLKQYGLDVVMEEVLSADIFVIGAGTTADPSYQKVHQALKVVDIDDAIADPENTAEMLYTPINRHGVEDDLTEAKIIGVKLSQCLKIKNMPNKYVILIAGGREKRISLQSIFKQPCANTIITDTNAADEAMKRRNEADRLPPEVSPPLREEANMGKGRPALIRTDA